MPRERGCLLIFQALDGDADVDRIMVQLTQGEVAHIAAFEIRKT